MLFPSTVVRGGRRNAVFDFSMHEESISVVSSEGLPTSKLAGWRGQADSGESSVNGWRSRRPHEKEAQVGAGPLCQWYDP